jgi:hypothetical protein
MNATSERIPISELELYGLSLRDIELLESELNFLYVDQFATLSEAELLATRNVGDTTVEHIRCALRNFVAGRKVKTVAECLYGHDT